MKRTNKLILSLALGATVAATFGTAFALYQSGFDVKQEITIGTVKTNEDTDGKVNYKINDVTSTFGKWDGSIFTPESSATEVAKLSPDLNRVMINAKLSFEYSTEYKGAKQLSAVGRFTVTVDLNENIPTGTNVYARLKGYADNTYFKTNKESDFITTTNVNSGNGLSKGAEAVSGSIDTAVDANSISCDITLDFSESITDGNFYEIAELDNAYTVTLKWEPYNSSLSEFDSNLVPNVGIRGDKASWDKNLPSYDMVPNIGADSDSTKVEWQYTGLTGFTLAKVYDGIYEGKDNCNPWIGCSNVNEATDASIDNNGNVKFTDLDKKQSYNVYYTRYGTTGFSVINASNS